MAGVEQYRDSEVDPVLRSVCARWVDKIRQAQRRKDEAFGEAADECLSFFNGPRTWRDAMMGGDRAAGSGVVGADPEFVPSLDFHVSVNKTFEFVTIFGPALYYESPVRTCKPRMPAPIPWDFFPDPQTWQALMAQEDLRVRTDGLRAVLLEGYLNWTPAEFRLDRDSRLAIDEALIKGRGCLWVELYRPPASPIRVVRSKFESVDDLLVDPDATGLHDATWIARRRCLPCWQAERDYGLRKGSLRGNCESDESRAVGPADPDRKFDRRRGLTNDLIVFHQVWSKMGLGGRLRDQRPDVRAATEPFGDYCYLAVADNVPFPLNCPPDVSADPAFAADPARVFARFAWPTPFWYDDGWPVACLDFHAQPRIPWPLPHLKAGMGELKFLNWVTSFLMGHLRTTLRTFIACKKSLGEDIKDTILHGRDLTLVQLEAQHGTISELVQFLNHPRVNGDVWQMIQAVEANFDKRVGLTELMYGEGGATQIRSAAEVNLRNQNMNVRPADMAKQVEAWMSEVAQMEALAARYHLRGDDVRPVLGGPGAWCWDAYVATTDLAEAARQLEYQIEAGSTRRPNKEYEAATMTSMAQLLLPLLQQYALATGDVGPMNNLLADLSRSRSLDPGRYLLRGLPAPPPAAPGAEGESPPGAPAPEESGEAAAAPGEHRNGRPAGALA